MGVSEINNPLQHFVTLPLTFAKSENRSNAFFVIYFLENKSWKILEKITVLYIKPKRFPKHFA